MTTSDPTLVTRVLLDAAGLPADDAELARFAAAYPGLRAQADTLYQARWTDSAAVDVAPAFGFGAAFPVGEAR